MNLGQIILQCYERTWSEAVTNRNMHNVYFNARNEWAGVALLILLLVDGYLSVPGRYLML